MTWTIWVKIGSLFGALAVAAGAFGAHALKTRLSPEDLNIFEVGARYQMYHALALVFLGLLATRFENTATKVAGISFSLGILIFSGSLYALVLSGQRMLGMITPLGGVLLIVGWLSLLISVWT